MLSEPKAEIWSFFMLLLIAFLLAAPPIEIADQKQLFIDQRFIADSDRVELHTNGAQKLGQILGADGQPIQAHVSSVTHSGRDHEWHLDMEAAALDVSLGKRLANLGGYPSLPT